MISQMLRNERQYRLTAAAVVGVVVILFGLAWYFGPGQSAVHEQQAARAVVEDFGRALKDVSLTGKTDDVRAAIETSYAPYVTPELLAQWVANPKQAPGRLASSPLPDRIGVATIAPQGRGYVVSGEIILITSTENPGESVDTIPFVALVAQQGGEWRIAAFEDEDVKTVPVTSDED